MELVVANHTEYNRRTMGELFRPVERRVWDAAGLDLSEQALLWRGDAKVVCLASEPDPALVAFVRRTLDYRALKVRWPDKFSPYTSRSFAAAECCSQLAELVAAGSPSFCWGATPQFRRLLKRLAQKGAPLTAPDLPTLPAVAGKHGDKLQLTLDSKAGSRRLLSKDFDGLGPLPFTPCETAPSLEGAVALLERCHEGAVLKCDGGAGGFNVRVFPGGGAGMRRGALQRELDLRARFDGFWRTPPYLVEKFIAVSPCGATLCPTADWLIRQDGVLEFQGLGVMTIRGGTRYAGVAMGRGALEEGLAKHCEEVSRRVAVGLVSVGYRGWFDVDMAVSGDGGVWITEINTRRTGPAHAIDVGKRLWGARWFDEGAVCTDEHVAVGDSCPGGFASLRPAFEQFNVAHGGEGLIAVPTFATHSLKRTPPYLGVLVAGGTVQDASAGLAELRERVRGALSHVGCAARQRGAAYMRRGG